MISLAIFVSILMLLPLGLYLLGVIRDPFHPLIFLGTVAYFVSPHRILTRTDLVLEILPAEKYITYLQVAGLCMLGIYLGWWLAGKNKNTPRIVERNLADPPQYDISRWVMFGVIFALIAVPVHFASIDSDTEISGWFRDLRMLWISSAILLVQFYCASPSYSRGLALFPLMIALVPPVERFLNYGQRGDTFRLAAVASLFYFARNRRPTKLVFAVAGSLLVITLSTLQLTRDMVNDGEARNRVEALFDVVPKFLNSTPEHISTADEYIFGSAAIDAVRQTHRYGYGTGITIGFIEHFIPRQILSNKDFGVFTTAAYDTDVIRQNSGIDIPYGSAPGGFAHAFFELGWGCWIVWAVLAYLYRLLWDRLRLTPDFFYQGILVGYTMAMLYALTQDILTAEVNIVYSSVPLFLVYKFSRVKTEDMAQPPVLTTTTTTTALVNA